MHLTNSKDDKTSKNVSEFKLREKLKSQPENSFKTFLTDYLDHSLHLQKKSFISNLQVELKM